MSVSFRLGLGFHALNNEGADGSNLMQPRRIDVGEITYDGISGEIVRRHVLENFVNNCEQEKISMLPLSAGLHPDRGPIGIRAAAKILESNVLESENLYSSVRKAIEECAVLDIGGFLAAFGQEAANDGDYVAEGEYLRNNCAAIGSSEPVKRESCFDVGWLISEEPQDLTITQHSAYRDTATLNSRFAQTMRSNIYGGVIRADLHRIGMDDHWYLLNEKRQAIKSNEQLKRQKALVKAIVDYIASPTGARAAAWSPHVFLIEGAILLTNSRTAPFVSPISVNLKDKENPVSANASYRESMQALLSENETWCWQFNDVATLIGAGNSVIEQLNGVEQNGQTEQK